MLLAAAFFALARQDVGSQHALSDAATPQEEPALLWGSADSTPDAWDPTTWPRDLFHPNPASLSFRVDSNLTSTAPTRHGGRLPPTGELRTRAQGVASDGPALCWKRSASSIWLAEQAQAGTVAEAGRSQRPPSESSLRLLGHWVLPYTDGTAEDPATARSQRRRCRRMRVQLARRRLRRGRRGRVASLRLLLEAVPERCQGDTHRGPTVATLLAHQRLHTGGQGVAWGPSQVLTSSVRARG